MFTTTYFYGAHQHIAGRIRELPVREFEQWSPSYIQCRNNLGRSQVVYCTNEHDVVGVIPQCFIVKSTQIFHPQSILFYIIIAKDKDQC